MLLAAGFAPSFLSLTALKNRALRKGVWHRVSPAARALIDAAILYLRRGGRIKSQTLAEALKRAAEEILWLITPIRVIAKTVGLLLAKTHGLDIDEEKAVALGLQWLNNPLRKSRRLAELTATDLATHEAN